MRFFSLLALSCTLLTVASSTTGTAAAEVSTAAVGGISPSQTPQNLGNQQTNTQTNAPANPQTNAQTNAPANPQTNAQTNASTPQQTPAPSPSISATSNQPASSSPLSTHKPLTSFSPDNVKASVTSPISSAMTVKPPTSSVGGNGAAAGANGWLQNIQNFITSIAGGASQNASASTPGNLVQGLVSRLPAILQGNLAQQALGGSSVADTLATLFKDPRVAGVPAWIEALVSNGNSSSALQGAQAAIQALAGQGENQQLQTLLSSVFTDVLPGLTSLNLTQNTSAAEVVSAIMADPSLTSSLSTTAQQLLGAVAQSPAFAQALAQQFPVDPNSQCGKDLAKMGAGIQNTDQWALMMLDAMGKLPTGVLTGQLTLFGDYDECMSVTPKIGAPYDAQLCGMALKPPEFILTRTAAIGGTVIGLHVCLPSSCTEEYLWGLFGPAVKSLGSQIYAVGCPRPKNPEGDDTFLGVMIAIGSLCLLCTIGTLYGVCLDSYREKKAAKKAAEKPAMNGHTNGGFASEPVYKAKEAVEPMDGGSVKNGSPATKYEVSSRHVSQYQGKVINAYANDPMLHGLPYAGTAPVNGTVNGSLSDNNGVMTTSVDTGRKVEEPVMAKPKSAAPTPEDNMCSKLVLSWSVLRNGRKLLATGGGGGDIGCLNGIRVLSICWVILGHCFSMVSGVQGNKTAAGHLLGKFTFTNIIGALFAVDTFFLLSGCLSAYLFLKSTKRSGVTVSGMVIYYLHRIWRLTPLYGLILAFYIGIFPYLKQGPYQGLQGMDSENQCRDYWYHNLLYINNLVEHKMERMCFGHSWYLANDMQFSFLAPLILVPWAFKGAAKLLGFALASALIVCHVASTAVISYKDELSMWRNNPQYMKDIYFVPWCRVGPYAVGLMLGFALFTTGCKYTMNKLTAFLGWTLAFALGFTLVYIQYDNVGGMGDGEGLRWSMPATSVFESVDKVLWGACVAWVVFACSTGNGGFINSLLSWKAWAPLSRLTYGVYLIHLAVLATLAGNLKRPLYVDEWTTTTMFLAVTVISYLCSFVFSMLIEAPTLGLEKAVLGKLLRRR